MLSDKQKPYFIMLTYHWYLNNLILDSESSFQYARQQAGSVAPNLESESPPSHNQVTFHFLKLLRFTYKQIFILNYTKDLAFMNNQGIK